MLLHTLITTSPKISFFSITCKHKFYSSSKPDEKRPRIRIRCLYRPYQTKLDEEKSICKDLNLLYWTDIEKSIDADLVEGKCFVRSKTFLDDKCLTLEQWANEGEYRFYFR